MKFLQTQLFKDIAQIILMTLVFGLSYSFIVYGNINFLERGKSLSESSLHSDDLRIQDVTIEKALQLIREGALIIDARSEDDYKNGHIKNAINIPSKNFDNYIDKVFEIPQDTFILIYCEGIHCNLSHQLAEKLLNFGLQKIYVMVEGIEGWKKRNLELVK